MRIDTNHRKSQLEYGSTGEIFDKKFLRQDSSLQGTGKGAGTWKSRWVPRSAEREQTEISVFRKFTIMIQRLA